ncbi:MAG: inner-rane translocator, branched-chain amino acid transport system permease protein [Candidatus Nomurabacteria bacterium]|nr:inner-rane translocator, branched-chain amino acid transport system permease protein [Candidatus Nomurabacteria bacterium]
MMDIVVQIALNAVIAGAIYSLVAIGFNLIYSTARFFDIGYGALATVGGYSVFYFYKMLNLPIYVSIILAIVISGAIGWLVEKLVYKKLRKEKASNVVLLIASLGVLTVIQAIVAILFTSQFQTLSKDIGGQTTYEIFGGVITQTQVLILVSGLLIMTALSLVLKYTLFGKAIRAVSDDEEVARIVGINSGRVMGWVFFIGSAIAGIAGMSVGFDTGIEPVMGLSLLLKGVIAVIVGGIGNIYGGVLGAFLLAIIENLGAWQFSGEWKDAISFFVLIIFLIFRPQGIWPK